jgi:two-component system response regulator
MQEKPIDILLVEDDPADIDLMREALKEVEVPVRLHVLRDGLEAISYLRKEGIYRDAACPDLILLDLNMPRKDGRQTLREIKDDEVLRKIPVVILTTSGAEEDVVNSYSLGANCYITKPSGVGGLVRVVKVIEEFWFRVAELPPQAVS